MKLQKILNSLKNFRHSDQVSIIQSDNVEAEKERKSIVPSDPLKLPDPCARAILKCFSGKELLTLMEVSKYWKSYIESSDILMSCAMNGVVARFDKSLIDTPLDRDYKHMRALFPQFNQGTQSLIPLIGRYAHSLETLILECGSKFEKFSIEAMNFMKLKKLHLVCGCPYSSAHDGFHRAFIKFIRVLSFPEVSQLCLPLEIIFAADPLEDIILKFPKLKTLVMETDFEKYFQKSENLPKIEVIKVLLPFRVESPGFNRSFIGAFKETVIELHINCHLKGSDLKFILANLKQLKSLTFNSLLNLEPMETPFPRHDLEVLKIQEYDFTEDIIVIHELLPALSSLKVFILTHETVFDDTIEVLGKLEVKVFFTVIFFA